MNKIKTVEIPRIEQHAGSPTNIMVVRVVWVCPVCGKTRGKLIKTISWDGSRRLGCDGWKNSCGHVDAYSAVRKEARENGLNKGRN